MEANATRGRRNAARMILAALAVVGVAGCAKEPPTEAERMSLKDAWTSGTTVTRAEYPVPVKSVYMPPPPLRQMAPQVRPVPVRPALAPERLEPVAPARPKQTAPARPPTLALSPPRMEPPPPAARPVSPAPVLPAPVPSPPRPLAESDLTAGTVRCGPGLDCVAVLRAMVDDPKQSWMMRAPTPAEFANGTRLFAYRALKTTLECAKLRFANAELDWAIDTFSNSRLEGVDAAHRARVAALAEEVHAEIEGEIKQRC